MKEVQHTFADACGGHTKCSCGWTAPAPDATDPGQWTRHVASSLGISVEELTKRDRRAIENGCP